MTNAVLEKDTSNDYDTGSAICELYDIQNILKFMVYGLIGDNLQNSNKFKLDFKGGCPEVMPLIEVIFEKAEKIINCLEKMEDKK